MAAWSEDALRAMVAEAILAASVDVPPAYSERVQMRQTITDSLVAKLITGCPVHKKADYRRVDLGLVATTIETMHRRIEELTGSRQSQYDGAVSLARDLYLTSAREV